SVFNRTQRFDADRTYALFDVFERWALGNLLMAVLNNLLPPRLVPARTGRRREARPRVMIWIAQLDGNALTRQAFSLELFRQFIPTFIEQVTGTLEEQHAEDIFLVFAGIHAATQVVTGAQEQGFEMGKRQFHRETLVFIGLPLRSVA